MKNRFDEDVQMTQAEQDLLDAVKTIFASKDNYGAGADFRESFMREAMAGYCDACGRGGTGQCYCTRDD